MIQIFADPGTIGLNFSGVVVHDDADMRVESGFASDSNYPMASVFFKKLNILVSGGPAVKAFVGDFAANREHGKTFAWRLLLDNITGAQLTEAVDGIIKDTTARLKLQAKAAIDALPGS
jgi:hypothetical protein